ncbi:hypothetical protein BDZ89DRAFT_327619 [Hymenopellis radicata]|nr:hypothetical protein BDZ89DRAFT_327619 [Hymenopellis radicata]
MASVAQGCHPLRRRARQCQAGGWNISVLLGLLRCAKVLHDYQLSTQPLMDLFSIHVTSDDEGFLFRDKQQFIIRFMNNDSPYVEDTFTLHENTRHPFDGCSLGGGLLARRAGRCSVGRRTVESVPIRALSTLSAGTCFMWSMPTSLMAAKDTEGRYDGCIRTMSAVWM